MKLKCKVNVKKMVSNCGNIGIFLCLEVDLFYFYYKARLELSICVFHVDH